MQRRRSMKTWALLVMMVWLCLAVGCKKDLILEGDGDGDVGDGDVEQGDGEEEGPIEEELVDVFQRLHDAECSMLFRCCGETERRVVFGLEGDEDDCREGFAAMIFDIDQGIVNASVAARRARLDEESVALCVASFLGLACDDWTTLEPARSEHLDGCRDMIQPEVTIGESCFNDFECFTGYCARGFDEEGSCQELVKQGEDCFESPCERGLYCDVFNEVCLPGQSNGSACFNDQECASGNCAQIADGSLSCQEPLAICGGN